MQARTAVLQAERRLLWALTTQITHQSRKGAEAPWSAESLSHDSLAVALSRPPPAALHTRRSLDKPQAGPMDSTGNRVETPILHRLWTMAQASEINQSARLWRAMEKHPISQDRPDPPALKHDPPAALLHSNSCRRMRIFRKPQAGRSSVGVCKQLRDSL